MFPKMSARTWRKLYLLFLQMARSLDYNRSMARKRRKRTKLQKRKQMLNALILILALIGALTVAGWMFKGFQILFANRKVQMDSPVIEEQLLSVNPYSRPGIPLKKVKGIVVHYTANPGTGAQANRNYFEGLKDSHDTKASSHYVIGLNGEILQCIPTTEIAYASNDRNSDTIAIECCHPDDSGAFNQETYDSLVHLAAWLCGQYGLSGKDVIRHFDVTGKACPKYYVDHPESWQRFLSDVDDYIDKNREK